MLFRFHAGTLKDSLKTTFEFETKEQLLEEIQKRTPFPVGPLQINYYGYDNRCKWRTYLVTDKTGVLGMTNGNPL